MKVSPASIRLKEQHARETGMHSRAALQLFTMETKTLEALETVTYISVHYLCTLSLFTIPVHNVSVSLSTNVCVFTQLTDQKNGSNFIYGSALKLARKTIGTSVTSLVYFFGRLLQSAFSVDFFGCAGAREKTLGQMQQLHLYYSLVYRSLVYYSLIHCRLNRYRLVLNLIGSVWYHTIIVDHQGESVNNAEQRVAILFCINEKMQEIAAQLDSRIERSPTESKALQSWWMQIEAGNGKEL